MQIKLCKVVYSYLNILELLTSQWGSDVIFDPTQDKLLNYVHDRRRVLSLNKEYLLLENLLRNAEKKGIYKLQYDDSKNNNLVVHIWLRIKKPVYFFEDFENKYKYLYPEKYYFVWFKLLHTIQTKEYSRRLSIRKGIKSYIKNRDGDKCFLCKGTDNLTIDHISPFVTSHDNTPYNLVTLCKKCNEEKDDYDFSDIIMRDLLNHLKANYKH